MNKQLRRKHVRAMLGGCSEQTLDRYVADPAYHHLGFPKPRYVGRTPLWDEREMIAWIEGLPRQSETSEARA